MRGRIHDPSRHPHMAFLGNDAVNRVNLHYGVQALAVGAGGVFFLAFLLHDGISVAATLATFAAILAGRFTLRPLVLPLAKRWGLKPIVIIGAVGMALEYPLLAAVHGVGPTLAALVIVSSAASTCYWPAYHAYFAAIGDAEHRGHQIGAREALAAVVGIVAPLLGGWALVTAGPWWTFGAVAVIQAASAIPLIGAPNVPVAASAPGALRAALPGLALFAVDGWFGAGFYYVWQVLLFVSLGQNLAAYGGAMALAALAGAVIGLLLGRHIDKGHGRRATVMAYAVGAAVVLMRAASIGSPWLAVAANAAGALVGALIAPAMMTAVYNLAKASPCPYRFHVATEGAWDAGCAGGALLAAGLAATASPMALAILAALPGVAVAAWLLWRYYGAHPAAGGVEVQPLLAGEPP
jgi:MFS family permease